MALRESRYLTADRKCFTVAGSLIWRSLEQVSSSDSEIDEHLQGAADNALYVLAFKQTQQQLTAGGPPGLAARVVAGMASDADTVKVEVTRLTIDSIASCRYKLRSMRVVDSRFMTSDKECVALTASVIWDPTQRNLIYREQHFPRLEETLRDYVLAELRVESARQSQAKILALDKKKLGAAIVERVKGERSGPPSLREVRVERIRRCAFDDR